MSDVLARIGAQVNKILTEKDRRIKELEDELALLKKSSPTTTLVIRTASDIWKSFGADVDWYKDVLVGKKSTENEVQNIYLGDLLDKNIGQSHTFDCHVNACTGFNGCHRPSGDCDGPPKCTPELAKKDWEEFA